MASSINAIRMIAQNPSRVDPYECYQEIVPEYIKDKDSVEVQKVFDDLFSFNDGLDQEQRRLGEKAWKETQRSGGGLQTLDCKHVY